MHSIIISFFASFVAGFLVLQFARKNTHILDYDTDGTQKFHTHPVPRIGGIAVFCGVVFGAGLAYFRTKNTGIWIGLLLAASLFAFGGGIFEDFTKRVSAVWRLIFTILSAAAGYYLLGAEIIRVDVAWIDSLLSYAPLSIVVTLICVAGIANGFNIIDGFNGLVSVIAIFTALSLAYVGMQVGDAQVATAALVIAGAAGGFLLWNYPHGLMVLGDGGAYFLGFMLSELAVLLVARNPTVSAWYAALLMIYPAFEVIFSIYRKKFIRGISPGVPDGVHLHMLVFKRLVRWTLNKQDARALTRRNALTSPYLWCLSLAAVVPATLLWRYTWLLAGLCALFVFSYVYLYIQIVRFNVPGWMILRRKK